MEEAGPYYGTFLCDLFVCGRDDGRSPLLRAPVSDCFVAWESGGGRFVGGSGGTDLESVGFTAF